MKFRNDSEARRQLLILLPVAALGAGLGFSLSWEAGCLALGLCGIFALLILWDTRRRYRTLESLCADLDRLLHGDMTISLDAYTEGAWSILHNQLVKLITRLREQADQLTRDKVTLADFLADVSHQLRTPLTALNLLGAQLSDPTLSPEKRQAAGRQLRRQLDRLDWLVSALLRMSRLDAGVAELHRESLSLRQVAEQAAAPLAIAMELNGQTLQIQGEADIQGDFAWTAEALGNIFKNCMEHTPAGGAITAVLSENPIYSQILIQDTGSGIAQKDLPHLFERFYRGENASAQSVGIGLSLARMIITAQNGTVQAANRREGGAQFTIRFYKNTV